MEKRIATLLQADGIISYCPVQKIERQWSDRKKIIQEALFKSYVFVRITSKDHLRARQVKGVVNFVSFMGKPAVIRDEEIAAIKQFLNDYREVKVERIEFNIHDNVQIIGGPFMNMHGNVTEVKHRTVKVMLPSLGCALSAEFEKGNLEKIHTSRQYKGYKI